jgi:hypothetical protein
MVKPPLRTKSIGFKVSEEEYAQLETAAQADGRTLGEWCREAILRGGSASDAERHDPALAEIVGVRLLWAGLAYDVGSLAGSAAVGGAGGRAIAQGINGVPSPPWSPASDWAQTGYKPSLGSPWNWLGTGPNPGSAGGAAAATGAGAAQVVKSGC